MIYLLFHEVRAWMPLIAGIAGTLALLFLILFLLTAGASIRTSANGGKPSRLSAFFRLMLVLSLTTSVSALFSALLGERAIQRAVGGGAIASWQRWLIGPATVDDKLALQFGGILVLAVFGINSVIISQTAQGSGLRLWLDRFRSIRRTQDMHGSSHFATAQEYKRFISDQAYGINLYGRFMGQKIATNKYAYLGDLFSLSAEDAARGLITIGNPGSGKSSAVILPILFDSMRLGQNLVVADPQSELTKHIVRYAAISGHRVILHDPTDARTPRYNLASGIRAVTDARAVADVLIPKGPGGDGFWTKSAEMLLAACLLRFDNIGDIYTHFADAKKLARRLADIPDDAQRLAGSFINSALDGDGKLASNIIATLSTSLTGWADETIRESTQVSDFDATYLVQAEQPTVLILASPGQARRVVAPYLGAVLTKLLLDLDTIGEQTSDGALPLAVKFIIDEFPALGDLNAIVEFANLVRKRRIAFLLACQTLGQLENIYGRNGTETLLAGMATQIVFGACDQRTAEYYSAATGQTTAKEMDRDGRESERGRRLLTADEVIRPPQGNALIATRYVTSEYATYAFVLARLTRIYERKDVAQAVKAVDKQVMRRNLLRRPSADETKRQRQALPTLPDDESTIKEADTASVVVPTSQTLMVPASKARLVQALGDFR